jgi:pimeloyl-ACP methyl ester carboxylesterase
VTDSTGWWAGSGDWARRVTVPGMISLHALVLRPAFRRASACVAMVAAAGAVAAAPATAAPRPTVSSLQVAPGAALEYCGNGTVDRPDPRITTVLVVVHGTGRNACDYAGYGIESATQAGRASSTLVVAPHFLAQADAPKAGTMYWSSGGWKEGDASLSKPAVSSYAALDTLVAKANATFPDAQVVVAGHSAGGQTVNRYAVGTQAAVDRFVVANPSSYLYLDSQRPQPTSGCTGYDTYKYGTSGRNAYMAATDVGTLRSRYGARQVTYLLGDLDTSTTSSSLDRSCEAKAQGAHRLERGRNYVAALPRMLGQPAPGHHQVIVPGVAHDGRSMLISEQGRAAIFAAG